MSYAEDRDRHAPVAGHLRRLCLRKGWSLGKLARQAGLTRETLHRLERGETRNPQNATLHKLARALEVPVEHLCHGPPGRRTETDGDAEEGEGCFRDNPARRRRFDRETNPVVAEVAGEAPELFAGWTEETWDELYSTFGTGGALNRHGVAETAQRINRKRKTLEQLEVLLETHLADVAARMVGTLYEMVVPDSGTDRQSAERDELSVES